MTLALHTGTIANVRDHGRNRVGDRVAALAETYAGRMNASTCATDIRSDRVDRDRYRVFLATFYPVVVGFNRALIRGIAKVDHVRHSSFVKALAEQLHEEQAHNQLWRVKMELFEIDHEALYGDLAARTLRARGACAPRASTTCPRSAASDERVGCPPPSASVTAFQAFPASGGSSRDPPRA